MYWLLEMKEYVLERIVTIWRDIVMIWVWFGAGH